MADRILAKIGKLEYMRQLLDDGIVYMKTLDYYHHCDSQEVGDPDDGLPQRFDPDSGVTVQFAGIPIDEFVSVKIAVLNYVYCMTGLQDLDVDRELTDSFSGGYGLIFDGKPGLLLNTRMQHFGDAAVVFRNSPEFVRRLVEAATQVSNGVGYGFVSYDADTCGIHHDPFRKMSRFKHQNEYRFAVDPVVTPGQHVPDHLRLQLGSLKDIAFLVVISKVRLSAST